MSRGYALLGSTVRVTCLFLQPGPSRRMLRYCSLLSLRLTPMGRLRQSRDELSREGRPRFNGAVLPVTNAPARWSRSIPSSILRTMASRPEIVLDIVPRSDQR
jgi:hypothetical protein